jgi:hypothetical protein
MMVIGMSASGLPAVSTTMPVTIAFATSMMSTEVGVFGATVTVVSPLPSADFTRTV